MDGASLLQRHKRDSFHKGPLFIHKSTPPILPNPSYLLQSLTITPILEQGLIQMFSDIHGQWSNLPGFGIISTFHSNSILKCQKIGKPLEGLIFLNSGYFVRCINFL